MTRSSARLSREPGPRIRRLSGLISDPVQPLANQRILVVEDTYLIAMDVKCWLMAAGATIVGPVPGVGQALALVDEASLDAAVLDVNLGLGDTPYPVAVAWAALQEPYIFATGDMRLSDANGAQDCSRLTKPYLE